MAEGIEIGFVGKITYYSIVVYLLFTIGLIIVCRQQYKSRQERRRRKTSKSKAADNCSSKSQCTSNKSNDNTEMGLFQSKKRGGYQVNKESKITKRKNVTKDASLHDDNNRPVSSTSSKSGEAKADDSNDRNLIVEKGKCNKNIHDSTEINDIQSVEKTDKELCGINVSTDHDQSKTKQLQKDTVAQEMADDRPVSVHQKTVINKTEGEKESSSQKSQPSENMGRQTTQKSFDSNKEIQLSSTEVQQTAKDGQEISLKKPCEVSDEAANSHRVSKEEDSNANISSYADQMLTGAFDHAYRELDSQLGEITNLADSVIQSSMISVMSHVNGQKKLTEFASDLVAKSITESLDAKDLIVPKSKPYRQVVNTAVCASPTKLSTKPVENKDFSSVGDSIENFSEDLSFSILDSALQTPLINSSQQSDAVRKQATKSLGSHSHKCSSCQILQAKSISDLSNKLADQILRNSFDSIDYKTREAENVTPIGENRVNINQQCENSSVPLITTTGYSDIDEGLNCETAVKVTETDANEICDSGDETENGSIDSSDMVENEEKSPQKMKSVDSEEKSPQKPVMLRNKNLLKVKLHTDRPLSGYAEQLAQFLADDDDSLELFESDEELDAVLDKMEEKYRGDKRINRKIQRRRMTSDSKKKESYPVANGVFDKKFDGNSSSEEIFEGEERSRLASNMSDSSFLSDTDTDELLKGSFSDDQLLSPGFSKFEMKTTAVIDTGCGVLKAGLAGEIAPRCLLPSVIGVPRRFSQDLSQIGRGYYVGDEAIFRAGMLQIDHPIKQNVTNWSDVNSLLEYVIEVELGINIRDHPLLLTENGLISKKQREKLTEIVFERHGAPAFFLANQGPLSLYSMGLMSGLCVNVGFSATQSIPVYEGHGLDYCTRQLDVGGHQISNHLGRLLLSTKGLAFSSSSEKFILNQMKERIGYVAEDPKLEQDRFRKSPDDVLEFFTLPDGQEIEVDVERFRAAEILFDPEEIGLEQKPIQSLIMDSIASADKGLQPTLTNHVVVTGGTSLLPGFTKRLNKELNAVTEYTAAVRLINASNPVTATWTGGSVISSRSTFSQQCITTDQYAEMGASVVHMKCF